MNPEILWRNGSQYKSDPRAAAEIIKKVQEESGDWTCQALEIVDAARPVDSPIHDDFEWDDRVAAELHRANIARNMIRGLVIVVDEGEPEPLFCHIRIGERSGYMPTRIALEHSETRGAVLDEARHELEAFRRKYAHLWEMANVIEEIRKTLDD